MTQKSTGNFQAENPERLVSLFESIRTDVFHCGYREMARILTSYIRFAKGSKRNLVTTKITKSTVEGLEKSTIKVRYIHIELYAHAMGVPSGVLLMVSFFKFDVTDKQRIADAMHRIFSENDNNTSIDDLLRLQALMKLQYPTNETQLAEIAKDGQRSNLAKLKQASRKSRKPKEFGLFKGIDQDDQSK